MLLSGELMDRIYRIFRTCRAPALNTRALPSLRAKGVSFEYFVGLGPESTTNAFSSEEGLLLFRPA